MAGQQEIEFVSRINENIGIAHKVANVYVEDTHDREDIFQEMMFQLWRGYGSFDGRSKFSTWMYRVCLNTALTYKRKKKKLRTEELSPDHADTVPAVNKDKEEAIAYLHKAIGTLSPLNKAIILLYLEDISYDEIATITGLSKGNVGVKIVRIKKELEEKITTTVKSLDDVNI
jgi:RNA polymerase sigma factor (sigma-70 family)